MEETYCGLSVRLALIDSGFNTAAVYGHCERHARWQPAKGVPNADKAVRQSKVDVSVTGRITRKVLLWIHSGDYWKSWLYARIQWPEDQPGGFFVPVGIDDEYCQQVVNERVHVSRGKREWVPTGNRRNHYLDCEVLAAAAAHVSNVRTLRERDHSKDPEPKTEKVKPSSFHSPLARRGL